MTLAAPQVSDPGPSYTQSRLTSRLSTPLIDGASPGPAAALGIDYSSDPSQPTEPPATPHPPNPKQFLTADCFTTRPGYREHSRCPPGSYVGKAPRQQWRQRSHENVSHRSKSIATEVIGPGEVVL